MKFVHELFVQHDDFSYLGMILTSSNNFILFFVNLVFVMNKMLKIKYEHLHCLKFCYNFFELWTKPVERKVFGLITIQEE